MLFDCDTRDKESQACGSRLEMAFRVYEENHQIRTAFFLTRVTGILSDVFFLFGETLRVARLEYTRSPKFGSVITKVLQNT